MRVAIIVNPVSGRGTRRAPAGGERIEQARRLASRGGLSVEIAATNGRGHAAELAGQFVSRGFARVIAWGGDGTINETAGPLVGSRAILGIVPSGSGDGLARSLGLPRHPAQALAAALDAPGESLDVGMLGGRHFLNIGGFGFDAAVAEAFNRRATRGTRGYLIEGLRRIWRYECRTYSVSAGDERVDAAHFLVAFANGREYGSGLVLAPDASPTDGYLNMITVTDGSPWRQLWRSRRLAYRRLAPAEGVRRACVTSATVGGEVLHGHVDGQPFEERGTLAVGIKPKGILIARARSAG